MRKIDLPLMNLSYNSAIDCVNGSSDLNGMLGDVSKERNMWKGWSNFLSFLLETSSTAASLNSNGRNVVYIGKIVPSPNKCALRDSNTFSHPYEINDWSLLRHSHSTVNMPHSIKNCQDSGCNQYFGPGPIQ